MDEILVSDLKQTVVNCKTKRAMLMKLQLSLSEPQKRIMLRKPPAMQSSSTEESQVSIMTILLRKLGKMSYLKTLR